MSSREEILGKIRDGLKQSTTMPYPEISDDKNIYASDSRDPLELQFAKEFISLKGKFVFNQSFREVTENLKELIANNKWEAVTAWHPTIQQILSDGDIRQLKIGQDLSHSNASIITAECLIARTGSILVSSRNMNGRTLSVYPEVVICIADIQQIVPDISDAFELMETKYGSQFPSMVSMMSGPSRTADIEKTLVLGAHGPKEVYVFLIENAETEQ